MHGPEVRCWLYLTLLRERAGSETALSNFPDANDRQYYIFGDATYMLRAWLQVAFSRVGASEIQATFNSVISAGCVTVEWSN